MSDIMYSVYEWYSALEAAEVNEFDPVDAGEDHGPPAAWLCEQYTHEKVNHNEEIMEAVISILDKEGHDAFSPETFMTVLMSHQGESETSFKVLFDEHMSDIYGFKGDLPGYADEEDYRDWYLDHCRNDDEVYAEVASGNVLHWFKKNTWSF